MADYHDDDAVADAIRRMDRMKTDEDNIATSSTSRRIVSAMGSPTPTSLLLDIRSELESMRRMMERLEPAIMDSLNLRRELDSGQQTERDSQLTKLLVSVSDRLTSPSPSHLATQSFGTPVSTTSRLDFQQKAKGAYYYRNKAIKTNWDVIGCFFAQLDHLVLSSVSMDTEADAFSADVSYWISVCREVSKSNSKSTSVSEHINVPPVSNAEVSQCRDALCSTTEGVAARFTKETLTKLVVNCPTVVGIISEIRQRLLKCQGIIGRSRAERLSMINYPFVDQNDEFVLVDLADIRAVGSKMVLDKVLSFKGKAESRKRYIEDVLANGTNPMVAASRI